MVYKYKCIYVYIYNDHIYIIYVRIYIRVEYAVIFLTVVDFFYDCPM